VDDSVGDGLDEVDDHGSSFAGGRERLPEDRCVGTTAV
jgi:hypothetical protein